MDSHIYNMNLHDTIEVKTGMINYYITRVPGGWIYNHLRLDSKQMNSVFIALDNEFQKDFKEFCRCIEPDPILNFCGNCKLDLR